MDAEVMQFLTRSVLCWLATSSRDHQPNVSPKEVFGPWQGRLLIANIASPQSVRNIRENPKVCVAFVDIFVQKGYQLKGSARLVAPSDLGFLERLAVLEPIAGPDFPIVSILEVSIDSAKPIVAPRYVLYPETTEVQQEASALQTYGVIKRVPDDSV